MSSRKIGALSVDFTVETDEALKSLRNTQAELRVLQKDIQPATTLVRDFGKSLTELGTILTVGVTVPLTALSVLSVKAASDFESSFAGVRKTVDGTEEDFKRLSDGIRNMSKELPVSVTELNRIGEAAGALGIHKEDIIGFTRQMAILGETTNLTSDQAATATAQIQNIFGAAGKETDRFASTLVALGNAGASTEKDIIEMSLRIAGVGKQVGLSQADVLAFASALSSVGINAEAGGSAISRVFFKMNDAVLSGGEKLADFAKIANLSAAEFKQAFEKDAAGATIKFIEGLGRVKNEGGNVNAVIEELTGKNIIIKDTLLRAAGAGELLAAQLKIGRGAWDENTAAVNEAEQRHKTFESQLNLVKNQFNDVAITLGSTLLPVLKKILDGTKPVVESIADAAKWFAALPEPVQDAAFAFGALAAAIGPLSYVSGTVLKWAVDMQPVVTRLTATLRTGGLTTALGEVSTAMGASTLAAGLLTGAYIALAAEAVYALKIMNDTALARLEEGKQHVENEKLIKRNIETMHGLGIAYDATNKTIDQQYTETAALIRQHYGLAATTEDLRKAAIDKATADLHASEESRKHALQLQAQAAAAEAAAEQASKLKAAVDGMVGSIIPTTFEAQKLAGAFLEFQAKGIPAVTITNALGKEAADLEKKYHDAGMTIPAAQKAIIDSIYLQYEAQQFVTAASRSLIAEEEQNRKEASALYETLSITETDVALLQMKGRQMAEEAWNEASKRGSDELFKAKQQLDFTETDAYIEELKKREKAHQEYAARIQSQFSEITSDLRGQALTWGNITDSFFGRFHDGALTIGNVARDAGIKIAGYFFAPLKEETDKFFNKIFGEIVDAALGPLRNKITGFVGDLLGGSSGGGLGLGSIGGNGGLIGSAISHIPGLGSLGNGAGAAVAAQQTTDAALSGAFQVSTGAAGTAITAGTTGTAAGGGLAGFLGAAAPFALPLVALGLFVNGLIGRTHLQADDLVQNIQNPFDEQFRAEAKWLDENAKAGTLRPGDAGVIAKDLAKGWEDILNVVREWMVFPITDEGFKAFGANAGTIFQSRSKVAQQFYDTENPYIDGTLNWANSLVEHGYDKGTPFLKQDGLVFAHAGEAIFPKDENPFNPASRVYGGGPWQGGNSAQATITVAPHYELKITTSGSSNERKKLIDQLTEFFQNNTGGLTEEVAYAIRDTLPGLAVG